jgi:type IV secretory pathway VirB3-like protein
MQRPEKAPKFPGEEDYSILPLKFTKLHRRSGDRFGLYLAETKNRFVVSDGEREVFAMFGLLITIALILLFMLIGKGSETVALIIVSGCLLPFVAVEVFLMKRLTTTLDRRKRRMIQETTRWLCSTKRNEFDLDVRVTNCIQIIYILFYFSF